MIYIEKKKHVCNFKKPPSKDGGWFCRFCNQNYRTKHELYDHIHECHADQICKRNMSKVCPNCHEAYVTTKREHMKICPAIQHGVHHWTEDERKLLSEKRKEYLKTHPEDHIWKRNDKFKSVPCERLKEILSPLFNITPEYTDQRWARNFSIDIALLNKKIAIEVNGNQHYKNDGLLTDYYQERHDYLINQGWKVYEIHYSWCYKEDKINELINAITMETDIDLTEHQLLFQNRKDRKKEKIRLNNCIGTNMITNAEWQRRHDLIIESGIDLSKFGWVGQVSNKTGLSKRIIENTVKRFDDLKSKTFYRSGSKIKQ